MNDSGLRKLGHDISGLLRRVSSTPGPTGSQPIIPATAPGAVSSPNLLLLRTETPPDKRVPEFEQDHQFDNYSGHLVILGYPFDSLCQRDAYLGTLYAVGEHFVVMRYKLCAVIPHNLETLRQDHSLLIEPTTQYPLETISRQSFEREGLMVCLSPDFEIILDPRIRR